MCIPLVELFNMHLTSHCGSEISLAALVLLPSNHHGAVSSLELCLSSQTVSVARLPSMALHYLGAPEGEASTLVLVRC